MKIVVTGGAGFIGSAVIRHLINNSSHRVCNLDKLTYAGNLNSLNSIAGCERYEFHQIDICDRASVHKLFNDYQPDAIMNLAAESHVDRSIDGPQDFIQTNIVGTYTLLDVCREYYAGLSEERQQCFRFHHISTDEVFGDLNETGLFTETTAYEPSSPYSASKASSDHLARAWHRTYGLPILLTNCSNNYGPYHFPEKLIPLIILNALAGKPLPVYGDGQQIRDWLYVDDHARALVLTLTQAQVGKSYNIGGHNERSNLQVVHAICDILDDTLQTRPGEISSFRDLIVFVQDRPGHDRRYAIDASKIQRELGWVPQETFESGLKKTVEWYLKNQDWSDNVLSGNYAMHRLGIGQ